MINYIREHTTEAGRLEQVAEEAIELAYACMKLARKLRGESPTPCPEDDLRMSVTEEASDLALCMMVAGVEEDIDIVVNKARRWKRRLEKGN